MELIDTHCHIQSAGQRQGERITREVWAKQPDLTATQLINDAAKAGVVRLICVGCDLADSQLAVNFAQDKNGCWASIGIHPHEAQHFIGQTKKLEAFEALLTKDKVIAIGECGLDYYYGHSPRHDQAEALKFQLELAQRHNLPLIFHVREAFDDFWPIFDEYHRQQAIRGVLHSFTDDQVHLNKGLERGLYIGVNGIATFAKQSEQLEVYASVPLERLLLETDAPFLTPTPYRGSINEPKYLRTIAECVAGLQGTTPETIARHTTQNARKLFGI